MGSLDGLRYLGEKAAPASTGAGAIKEMSFSLKYTAGEMIDSAMFVY
jgi:hypothetical protein